VRRSTASYERALATQGVELRQARAQADMLLRQRDELMHIQEVIRGMFSVREDAANRVATLTPRQHGIMEMVLAGKASKVIAWELGISQRTVENHRSDIMRKTGAKGLADLARMALAAAWNESGEPMVQPLARLALDAAWNGADSPATETRPGGHMPPARRPIQQGLLAG
jgi:DNA-binding CsgD family transcriptional regulator